MKTHANEMSTTDPITDHLQRLLEAQTFDPSVARLELVSEGPDAQGCYLIRIGEIVEPMGPEAILQRYEWREKWIEGSQGDHYNDGIWFSSWDENLWEMCRLQVENPGVPVHFLVGGSNGSAKTYFAACIVIRAMMQTTNKMFWCLAIDEHNSETVQQTALYYWLPNDYKTERGGIKSTARAKLKYNDSGGFTDNRFSLYHGAKMECRFWSKDIKTLEGPRPYAVWSDEEIPLPWIEGIDKRLLTQAEPTRALVPKWKRLLREKAENPEMLFPRDLIGELMMGMHLITYTAKDGWTDTVRVFQEDGRIMREIEADPELLPRRTTDGVIIGGEMVPKLIYSKDPARRMIFMHAWDNPKGGNWEAMRLKAKVKPRSEILWWCYGVAEKSSESPFPNFNPQMHVRPFNWLPRVGTWYCIADPVASGGRCWFMLWAIVCGEQSHGLAPGDIFIAHEYPQDGDAIAGIHDKTWALTGGKNGKGVRGPAQKVWSDVGYEWRAEEIKRVERKLAALQGKEEAEQWEAMKGFVPYGCRIIDPRAGNTDTAGQQSSKSIIDYMRENGLTFVEPGRDGGSAPGEARVFPGEQTINSLLAYNRDLAVIDPKTGWLEIDPQKGKGPRIRISETCKNLIAALQNYPGYLADKDSPWKDPIDCLRYLVVSDPRHVNRQRLMQMCGDEFGY